VELVCKLKGYLKDEISKEEETQTSFDIEIHFVSSKRDKLLDGMW